jgi:hypothetical protein
MVACPSDLDRRSEHGCPKVDGYVQEYTTIGRKSLCAGLDCQDIDP